MLIPKEILRSINKLRRTNPTLHSMYYNVLVTKTHASTHIDQYIRLESSEINLHFYKEPTVDNMFLNMH